MTREQKAIVERFENAARRNRGGREMREAREALVAVIERGNAAQGEVGRVASHTQIEVGAVVCVEAYGIKGMVTQLDHTSTNTYAKVRTFYGDGITAEGYYNVKQLVRIT